MTLIELKSLLDNGNFDHATYRDIGTLWEGLKIYSRECDNPGGRGFVLAGSFLKDDPDLKAAEEMVRHTGISLGSRGNG